MTRRLGLILLICAGVVAYSGPVTGIQLRAQQAEAPARKLLPSALHVDDAVVAARQKAALAWNLKTLAGAYDQIGSRSPKWDDLARRGLTMTARIWAHDPARPGDAGDQAWYALHRAVKLGCDDPLVQYLDVVFSEADLPKLEAAHTVYAATIKIVPSRYHAYLKSLALVESARTLSDASSGISQQEWEPRWNSIIVIINRAHELMPGVFMDREMPEDQLVEYVNAFFDPFGRSGNDRHKMFDHVEEEFLKVRGAKDPLLQIMRADSLASSAWDVRGSGMADTVKPAAWPVFRERLRLAEDEAAKAVALGVTDYSIVRVMNRVALGLYGDSDELGQWFEAGKRLSPGDQRPYSYRLYTLEPKWLGSVYEMMEFARKMQDSSNWSLRLPLLMATAHEDLAAGLDADLQKTYYADSLVCGDVLGVYAGFLEKYPESSWDRGSYVKWLSRCGRWSDAKRQLDLIPSDRLRVGAFGGQEAYEQIRKRAMSSQ